MMGMGGGGGGGGGGKRALTQLVGKLELLSRPDLKLHVELDAEQTKAIAAKLVEFEKAEKMSGDDAQKDLEEIEGLLTAEQKDALAAVGLPFGGGGGRGGRGGGGGGMGGGMGGGGMGGMMGMGGGNPDENPFTQETNKKRLSDLLTRIAPGLPEPAEKKE